MCALFWVVTHTPELTYAFDTHCSRFTIYLEFISLDMQGHSAWFIHLLFDLIGFFSPCIFLIHFVVIFLVFKVSGDLPAKSPALKLCLVTRDVGFYILFARDVHNYYLASIFLGFVYGFIYVWALGCKPSFSMMVYCEISLFTRDVDTSIYF